MKKIICFLLMFLFFISCASAVKIDPYYLKSDVIDMDKEAEKKQKKQEKKERKKQQRLEKQREKYKKRKKINRYKQIDKSQIPVTTEDYDNYSAEKLRRDYEIPEPEFNKDKEIKIPNPKFRVISYNRPAGARNMDLSRLALTYSAHSPAILSPDKNKIVYTKCFFYPETMQTASSVYFIPVNGRFKDIYDILYNINALEGSPEPVFTAGEGRLEKFKFTVLFPLDFSKDSRKIAFKEKTGSNIKGVWQTNIAVYDFKTNSVKRLDALRDAIVNYWQIQKKINLADYMWDIYPLGWDKNNPDRLIAYAYAYTDKAPKFLGTWSIYSDGKQPALISEDKASAEIDMHGFGLLEIKMQN